VKLNYYTVNAFTDTAFEGTQVLVFPEANGLDSKMMHKITREFGFPDTVFITDASHPTCQAKFRLFTKSGETDFEGHATIAAAYVLQEHRDLIAQRINLPIYIEEGSEKIAVNYTIDNNSNCVTEFVVDAKAVFDTYVPSFDELGRILCLDSKAFMLDSFKPLVSTCKKTYIVVPVRSPEELQLAKFSPTAWISTPTTSTLPYTLFVFAQVRNITNKQEFHARIMGDGISAEEDPPIGSALPAFANYLLRLDFNEQQFVIKRGVGHDRLSTLNVQIDAVQGSSPVIRVGGRVTQMSTGTLNLHTP